MIKGILFDVDGTLLDSMHIWDEIGERYLLTQKKKPAENLNEYIGHLTLEEAADYFVQEYGVEKEQKEIVQDVLKLVEKEYTERVELKKGCREFLQLLSQRDVKIYAATASDRTNVTAAFERHNIMHYFQNIYTCSELECSKDKSLFYEKVSKLCGFKEKEVLVFEDVYHAAVSAKRAGCRVIGVLDKYSLDQKHKIINICDYFIEGFNELLNEKKLERICFNK